jgi:drug/metabolite transporter (DMT)-like permease
VGFLFVLGSAFALATMGPTVKAAYDAGASVWGLNAVRFLCAAAAWIAVFHRQVGAIPWRSRAVAQLLVAGGLGASFSSFFEFDAYHFLPVANVVVVLFTVPIWLALAQWRFRRRGIGRRGVAAIALVILGLALLYETGMGRVSLMGLGLALMASVLFGVFLWFSQEGIAELGATQSLAVVFASLAAVSVVGALLEGSLVHSLSTPAISGRALQLGLLGSALGVGLAYQGLSRLGAFEVSVIGAAEPVFAAILAWIFRGESLRLVQMVGVLLVLAGTVIVQRPPDRAAVAQTPAAARPAAGPLPPQTDR